MQDLIQQIATYRDFFMGKPMQWIKNKDRTKWSKIVTVNDVFNRGKEIYAQMSDGSVLPINNINNDLMMITQESPALSLAAVQSINDDPGVSMSAESVVDDPALKAEVKENIQATRSLDTPISGAKPVTENQQQPRQPTISKAEVKAEPNYFAQFGAEKSNLNLSLSVNLPPMNLLKMMYNSAKDKDKFLKDLCQHINNQITEEVIQSSIIKKLDSKKQAVDERTE